MSYKDLEYLWWLKLRSILLFEPSEPLQALIWLKPFEMFQKMKF